MIDSRVRVAIFHLGFFYSGGGEKLVLEEIRGLRTLGYEVRCYAPYVDIKECFPNDPEMVEIVSLLPPPPKWLPMRDPLWITLSCLLVPLLAWKFRAFDVLFGANQPGSWFAFVVSKMLRKPYVIYLAHPIRILHPREIDKENELKIREGDHRYISLLTRTAGWFIDWADRTSVRKAQAVLANGHHASKWLDQVYGRRSIECSAGCYPVNASELDYEVRQTGQFRVNSYLIKKPYALITNRHVPQKRFEYALWALKMISSEIPELSIVITGQATEYTEQLKYLVEGLGLRSNVKFVDLVKDEDLSKLYSQAILYIYPSPEEDFGMGIIEAMSTGTPVVAWRNGGPTVTVKDRETGFLVEPYDTDTFATRILDLATNPELAELMGRSAHQRAYSMFSYDHHNQLVSDTLRDAIDQWRRSAQDKSPRPEVEETTSAEFLGWPSSNRVSKNLLSDNQSLNMKHEQLSPASLDELKSFRARDSIIIEKAEIERE